MLRMLLGLPVAALLAVGPPAQAQTEARYSCTDDMMGGQVCRDPDGDVQHVHKDAAGEIVTDDQGHMARVQHDGFGNVTIWREDGSMVQGHTDALGQTTYTDPDGHRTVCGPAPIPTAGETDVECRDGP